MARDRAPPMTELEALRWLEGLACADLCWNANLKSWRVFLFRDGDRIRSSGNHKRLVDCVVELRALVEAKS